MVQLHNDERFDYLFAEGEMKIIQSPTVFSFSLDAVLLAHFTRVPAKKGYILDLCSGNGVIPLMLSKRTKTKILGVEIQKRLVEMASKSIRFNKLSDQLSIIHGDLKNMQSILGHSRFDVVTCNPPYFQTSEKAIQNKNKYFTIAKHEVLCTLEDAIKSCKLHVKPGGRINMVHRSSRFIDLITLFRAYKLEPKRIQFVYSKIGKEANMVLIEAIRDGKPGLKMLPPLYIYNHDHSYTKEAEDIIYGRS